MCAHNHGDDVPHGTTSILNKFGHLAGWAALYSIGVTLVLAAILDREVDVWSLAYVTLCAHAGYLLDRVKFRDRDLDPADLMAEPERHQYLRRHAAWIRWLMIIEWVAAIAVGAMISLVLVGLVLVGVAAGIGYAGWKPGKVSRLKDLAGLKAVLVSGAVTGLATFTVYRGELSVLYDTPSMLWVILGIAIIVFGDAVTCDLDDELSDDAFRTRSLPVMLGGRWAALVGMTALVLGAVVLTVNYASAGVLVFGCSIVLSAGLILGLTQHRRDWIDGRLIAIALISIQIGF